MTAKFIARRVCSLNRQTAIVPKKISGGGGSGAGHGGGGGDGDTSDWIIA